MNASKIIKHHRSIHVRSVNAIEPVITPQYIDRLLLNVHAQYTQLKSVNPHYHGITIGMSSGVDSTLTAWLLCNSGIDSKLIGAYMNNWNIVDESNVCRQDIDSLNVERYCDELNIDYKYIDLSTQYWLNVFQHMITQYEVGNTPNPDVLCNREIKFNIFTDYVKHQFNTDIVATGHYARIQYNNNQSAGAQLFTSSDILKDQSYFLSAINNIHSDVLSRVLMPLGCMRKTTVRAVAKYINLKAAAQPDSMGVCFIGKRKKFSEFLSQYINMKPGNIVDMHTNNIITQHNGVQQYTIGQRIKLSGHHSKLYVTHKSVDVGDVYVTHDSNNSILYSDSVELSDINWLNTIPQQLINTHQLRCEYKIRSNGARYKCTLYYDESMNKYIVSFDIPQHCVAVGQYIVLYHKHQCTQSAIDDQLYTHTQPNDYIVITSAVIQSKNSISNQSINVQ